MERSRLSCDNARWDLNRRTRGRAIDIRGFVSRLWLRSCPLLVQRRPRGGFRIDQPDFRWSSQRLHDRHLDYPFLPIRVHATLLLQPIRGRRRGRSRRGSHSSRWPRQLETPQLPQITENINHHTNTIHRAHEDGHPKPHAREGKDSPPPRSMECKVRC